MDVKTNGEKSSINANGVVVNWFIRIGADVTLPLKFTPQQIKCVKQVHTFHFSQSRRKGSRCGAEDTRKARS